jgi:hypothetical protein
VTHDAATSSRRISYLSPHHLTLSHLIAPAPAPAPPGELGDEFFMALNACDKDPACRVVVVTGEGRAFCAGADAQGRFDPSAEGAEQKVRPLGWPRLPAPPRPFPRRPPMCKFRSQ